MKKKTLLGIFFLLHVTLTIAQVTITGTVSDNNGKLLNGVSITASEKGANMISAYCISHNNGQYRLTLISSFDSLDIAVSHIGFKEIQKRIVNATQTLNFTLLPGKIEMPLIVIESKLPVTKKGDTISYNIKTFTAPTDRVIADVLKKLPGIEVDANGQVKYNGKPISNYYIEGLDLLGGRYNIANQNIPADMVEKVQVLENHQPVKVLDSFLVSDNTALNIKLTSKAKNKFFFNVKAGAGMAPLIWQDELAALNFRKDFQFISGYKTNNTGVNLGNELNQLTADQFDKLNVLNQNQDLLSLVNPLQPSIDNKRYLINKTHLVYTNGLFVTGKFLQIKYHIGYLTNNTQQTAATSTTFWLPHDTLTVNESQQQKIDNKKLFSELMITVNRPNFYIRNNLKAESNFTTAAGTIKKLSDFTQQELINSHYQVTNNFHIILAQKNNRQEFNSSTVIKNMPEQLTVFPGPFADFFNQGIAFESLQQKATQQTLAADNYLNIRKHFFSFSQNLKLGLQYQQNTITSSLVKGNNSITTQLEDTMQNNLHWKEIKPYIEMGADVVKNGYHISISSTLINENLQRRDHIIDTVAANNYLFSNNAVTVRKNLHSFYNITLTLNNSETMNNITQNTQGYILNTYRNIARNTFALQKNRNYNSNISVSYSNPVKALFGYFSFSYGATNKNLLPTSEYDNELETVHYIEKGNWENSLFYIFSLNKFFKKSKISAGISSFYSTMEYPQVQQNILSKVNSSSHTLKFNISSTGINWLYPEYNIIITRLASKVFLPQIDVRPSLVNQITQNLSTTFFITSKLSFTAASSYYYTKQGNSETNKNFFLDYSIGYKKGVYDIELKILNVTNIHDFKTAALSENMQYFSNFKLRPTNGLVLVYIKI